MPWQCPLFWIWDLVSATASETGRLPLLLQTVKERNVIIEGEFLHEERKGPGGKIWLRDSKMLKRHKIGIQEAMEQPVQTEPTG